MKLFHYFGRCYILISQEGQEYAMVRKVIDWWIIKKEEEVWHRVGPKVVEFLEKEISKELEVENIPLSEENVLNYLKMGLL